MAGGPVLRSWRWTFLTVAYLTLIYALLPWARPVWDGVRPLLREHESAWFLVAGVGVVAALCLRAWTAGRARRVAGVVLLLAVLAAYVLLLTVFYRGRVTIEKVHILEYGVLAYLALNAVTVTSRGGAGVVLAAAFVAAAGYGDEALQRLLPLRYFDWYDIVGNWIGSALGSVAWLGASAHSPWRRTVDS